MDHASAVKNYLIMTIYKFATRRVPDQSFRLKLVNWSDPNPSCRRLIKFFKLARDIWIFILDSSVIILSLLIENLELNLLARHYIIRAFRILIFQIASLCSNFGYCRFGNTYQALNHQVVTSHILMTLIDAKSKRH